MTSFDPQMIYISPRRRDVNLCGTHLRRGFLVHLRCLPYIRGSDVAVEIEIFLTVNSFMNIELMKTVVGSFERARRVDSSTSTYVVL